MVAIVAFRDIKPNEEILVTFNDLSYDILELIFIKCKSSDKQNLAFINKDFNRQYGYEINI
jgi:hypothetical protein